MQRSKREIQRHQSRKTLVLQSSGTPVFTRFPALDSSLTPGVLMVIQLGEPEVYLYGFTPALMSI